LSIFIVLLWFILYSFILTFQCKFISHEEILMLFFDLFQHTLIRSSSLLQHWPGRDGLVISLFCHTDFVSTKAIKNQRSEEKNFTEEFEKFLPEQVW